jgi:hypothetical protein
MTDQSQTTFRDPARVRQIYREKAECALDRWGAWRGFVGSDGLRDAVADALQREYEEGRAMTYREWKAEERAKNG